MSNLGWQLESWLHKNPLWAAKKQALALDIVKLEWAEIEAFDGKAEPPLRPEDLAANAGANLRLRLQPYIQLLSLRYPVDDLLLEIKNSSEENEVASNAFQERRKRKRVQTVAKLKPAAIALAVHRIDNSVYFRRLEPEEFALLVELNQGRTLQKAVDHAFSETKVPPQELPALVKRWFHNRAPPGWFCQPQPQAETSARSKNRTKGKRTGARRKIA